MLSETVTKTAQEVMRQSQNGTHPISVLAERLCMLMRIAAKQSDDPKSDIEELCSEMEPYIPEKYILDAITGRILAIFDEDSSIPQTQEKSLDSLLEQVRDAESEMAEQLSSLFKAGDDVLIMGEREGGFVEASLKDAADGLGEEAVSAHINVTIVAIMPDHEGLAAAMSSRLGSLGGLQVQVIPDVHITKALRKCNMVLLPAFAVDIDDGSLCYPGSTILCSAANRLKVPVVVAVPQYRILPVGSSTLGAMGRAKRSPGRIWEYSKARNDLQRDAISVISSAYDLVQHERCEMVVTEFGGYSTDYLRAFAPSFDTPSPEAEQD